MKNKALRLLVAFLSVGLWASAASAEETAGPKIRVLIVDGQNNHNWQATTPFLQNMLEKTGRFSVKTVTTPPKNAPEAAWTTFRPEFSRYDVVLSNYNGDLWPEPVRKDLETFISKGGGLVVVHAANNAFPEWNEWNRMIGLGWRKSDFGERVALDDSGNKVRTPKGQGPGAGHGPQHAYPVVLRDRKHPVMQGLPAEWMHTKDELYHGQRGPALNMHILATAYSSPSQRGTGAHEPMVWWIPYGQGRVFTTVLGHVGGRSNDLTAMRCIGFQTIVNRGCEWAATGKVTLPVPDDFPTADKTSTTPQ